MTDDIVQDNEGFGRTSTTLLVRMKEKDQTAWTRFVHLYGPLVFHWCRRFGLSEADSADVGQEVFRTVAESIDRFHRNEVGDSFRGWLRTITKTRVLDFYRKTTPGANGAGGSDALAALLEVPELHTDSWSEGEDDDEKQILVRRALDMVLECYSDGNRQAFLRVLLGDEHPADVAQDLGMTVNAVYLTKSRILARLREEFANLVDV